MNRRILTYLFYLAINISFFVSASYEVIKKSSIEVNPNVIFLPTKNYTPDWDSLDSRPLPKWFDEAKVGIFIHWGVYSVPSFGSEWFWWNWQGIYNENYTNYMERNYRPGFTYQEFAPDFTAELFDPKEWAEIFENSGAQYVVLTSKHHDGYALWPSKYSFGWNSKDVGSHRDLVGELRDAIVKNTKLKFGLYHSLYEWFNPLYLKDKASNFTSKDFVKNKVWPEMQEIVSTYKPEVLWSDGDWETDEDYWESKEFLAWLYNKSPVRKTIVTNDRWGRGTGCKHGDFYNCADRFNPGVLQEHKWENAFTIDKKSWGNRGNAKYEDFMTPKEVIRELVTTVSCNGNILINVGPSRVGTIDMIFVERLAQMGRWLKRNGKAIYKTIPWTHQNDSLTKDVWYTAEKKLHRIWDKENNVSVITQNVYATVLEYPYETNYVELRDLGMVFNENVPVELLGYPGKVTFDRTRRGVILHFPNKQDIDVYGLSLAWTFQVNTILNKKGTYSEI
uniref:Putative alpha-L-fucosidase n=1 Tax=Culicoides sonorensis TaxID=179676 RepID=A0A336LZR5_CULSO